MSVFFFKSSFSQSNPTWLTQERSCLLRRFFRSSKDEPVVDKVHLDEANQLYARVQVPDGRQSPVSLIDLAPCSDQLSPTAGKQMACSVDEVTDNSLKIAQGGLQNDINPLADLRRSN